MPLLTVVIPTRNRNKYLLDSIKVIIENVHDVEIILCDNSDTDILNSMLEVYRETGRIKYLYSSEKLSVVDNFERAFTKMEGDYVISIGDDDTIGPEIETIARWAKLENVEAVISYKNAFIASYYWPGVRSRYFGSGYESRLFVNSFTGEVAAVDPILALKKVAQRLGSGLGEMPRAYHGLVSRSLLERIRNSQGHLFGGVSPDIYSAALISGYCLRMVAIDFPFVIPGASPSSTAGQGAARSDRGTIQSTEHTARFGDKLDWDERIPEFYSPHTVWAYSLCKALDRLPNLRISPEFSRLYASCLMYYPKHYKELFQAMGALARTEGRFRVGFSFAKSLIIEVFDLLRKVSTRLCSPRAGGQALRFSQIETISLAYAVLNEHIKRTAKSPKL